MGSHAPAGRVSGIAGALGGQLATAASGLARGLRRRWQNRLVRRHLEGLDEYLLRDIGIARADIDRALGTPPWLDQRRR